MSCSPENEENKESENFAEKVMGLSGVKWGVCRWGSCQYSSAQSLYDALEVLFRKTGSISDALKGLGLQVATEPRRTVAQVLKMLSDKEEEEEDKYDNDEEDEGDDENTNTIDRYLIKQRKRASDLWAAIPKVFRLAFPNTNIHVVDSPGIGPSLNVLVQSDNYRIGLMCWLLRRYDFVKSDSCFRGFDT